MTRGRLIAAAAGLALLLIVWWALGLLFVSDEERLADAIEDARDALLEKRDDDFLAFFTPDIVYRDRFGFDRLQGDLRSWRAAGLAEAHILTRDIQITPDGVGHVDLLVAVGQGFLSLGRVRVEVEAVEVEKSVWRARVFRWRQANDDG